MGVLSLLEFFGIMQLDKNFKIVHNISIQQ
jgi:hypothetical protein